MCILHKIVSLFFYSSFEVRLGELYFFLGFKTNYLNIAITVGPFFYVMFILSFFIFFFIWFPMEVNFQHTNEEIRHKLHHMICGRYPYSDSLE